MRSAKRGKEIVKRVVISRVHHCDPGAPLVAVAIEDIVVSHGEIEKIARGDAGRIVIVILGAGLRES